MWENSSSNLLNMKLFNKFYTHSGGLKAVFVIILSILIVDVNAGVITRREVPIVDNETTTTTRTPLTIQNTPSENVTKITKLIPQHENVAESASNEQTAIKKTTLKMVDNLMATSDTGTPIIKENIIPEEQEEHVVKLQMDIKPTMNTIDVEHMKPTKDKKETQSEIHSTTMSNSIDGDTNTKDIKQPIIVVTENTKAPIVEKGLETTSVNVIKSTTHNPNKFEKDLVSNIHLDKNSTVDVLEAVKVPFDLHGLNELLRKNTTDETALNNFPTTTKSVELTLDGSNEIQTPAGGGGAVKQPKFLDDNSTNSNQLNLPNTADVWTLAGMKSVPNHSQKLEMPENNGTQTANKEKSVTDWTQIVQMEVGKSVGNALTEDQTIEDETTADSNIQSTELMPSIVSLTSSTIPNESTTTTRTTSTTTTTTRTTTLTPTISVNTGVNLSPIDNVDTSTTRTTANMQTPAGEFTQESKENDVEIKSKNEEQKMTSSSILNSSKDSSSTTTTTTAAPMISTPTNVLESTTQIANVGNSNETPANKLNVVTDVIIDDNSIETTTTIPTATIGTEIELDTVAATNTVSTTIEPTILVTNVKEAINSTPPPPQPPAPITTTSSSSSSSSPPPDVNQNSSIKSNLETPTNTTTETKIVAIEETTTPSTSVHRENSSAIVNQTSKLKDENDNSYSDNVNVNATTIDSLYGEQTSTVTSTSTSTGVVEFVTLTPAVTTTTTTGTVVATATTPQVDITKDLEGVTTAEVESTTIVTTTPKPPTHYKSVIDSNEGSTTETSTTTIQPPTSITPNNSTTSDTIIVEYKVSTEEAKIETTTKSDAKININEMTTTTPTTIISTSNTATTIPPIISSTTNATTPAPAVQSTTVETPVETTTTEPSTTTTTTITTTTTTPKPTEMLPISTHSTKSLPTPTPESSTLDPLILQSAVGVLRPPKSSAENPETDVNVVIAISVSVIGVVALILLVAFLYLMRKRQKQTSYGARCRPANPDAYSLENVSVLGSVRRKGALRASKRTYGNAAFDDPSLRHNVLQTANDLAKFIERRTSIFEEFRDVPQIIARREEIPPGCEDKNRYANVIPLPETRVILQRQNDDDTTEYINANYVRGPNDAPNYYIACQAPSDKTVQDFWRMIWEQQSRVIIQATDLIENGVEKCAEYLPPSVTLDNHTTFGNFQVTLKNREVKDKYAISTIMLKDTVSNSSREITHYWYKWPETGVPSEEAPIIAMLLEARSSLKSYAIELMNDLKEKGNSIDRAAVNETQTSLTVPNGSGTSNKEINGNVTEKSKNISKNQGPLTIHCSPGTGRTGTIISIDMAIRSLETKKSLDIPQIVYYVRRGRASAVQTKEQYEFIYKVANVYAMKITNIPNDN